MSFKSNFFRASAIGAVITVVTAGAALAAVATTSVNVRTGPGTSYGILDQLSPGDRVAVTDQAGGWCEVSRPGPNGWVSCAYLTSSYDGPRRFNRYDGPRYYDEEPSVSFSFGIGGPPRHRHFPPPPPPFGFPGHGPYPWH
jgi:uncharacterized protein YraI